MIFKVKPIEFALSMSEVEVRSALKEVCGSRLDGLPFGGEVEHSTFRLVRHRFWTHNSAAPVILLGSFAEQNGKTYVNISSKRTRLGISGIWLIFAAFLALAVWVFMAEIANGIFTATVSALCVALVGAFCLAVEQFLFANTFRRDVRKLKQELTK